MHDFLLALAMLGCSG
jgi:hypothetical protein